MEDPILAGYRNSLSGQLNRFPIPFAFPFAPLSLGLFDTDPSRILNLLHHQTLLAEEALRYRGVFLGPKEGLRYNPLADILSNKEHEQLLKRNNFQTRPGDHQFRYQMGLPDLLPTTAKSHIAINDDLMSKHVQSDSKDYYNTHDLTKLRSENIFSSNDRSKNSQKELIDEILLKRGGSYLKDGIRFNPLSNVADQHKDKSNTISSSLSSASSSSSFKGLPETVLINEASVTISEDESKCNTCNAVFPSTWLLEQHIALQHSSPGSSNEEKSFLCDQYRNALAKHRESQNQRSRIPADKLFTCDVCGMQFRYLKSFKKHRLNHALERIHGKNGKGSSESNNELVSSSNEMMDDNIDLNGMIKDEEEDDDQNDMIDSMTRDDHLHNLDESQMKITSSEFEEMHSGSGIHSTESIGSIKVRSPAFLQKSDVESSIPTTTLSGLLRPDTTIGLSAQDTSLINFLRNDVEKQQNKSTPVSRFACPFCGKCVRSKENLKLHVRKHTGERPFVCLFCGRAFGGKSDLTRHLRIHTGERPYHCEACGKCFARADYLSKHLTTHLHNTSR